MKKSKKEILTTVFLVFIVLVGLSVMLYPAVSDWWNKRLQLKVVTEYNEETANIPEDKYDEYFKKAEEYNSSLSKLSAPFNDFENVSGYDDTLDISGTGVMGIISIPVLNVEIPIYHGTSKAVLNSAVGHMEGSSLPIGGENTHSVISGHRGLPSAKLFTDLDRMVEGDVFTITILDRVLTYEVEKIMIIKPDQVEKLAVIPGGDYVTLMTCTPYGINTHRLLIRSHRIENAETLRNVSVRSDAVQVDSLSVVPVIAAPILIMVLVIWDISGRIKRRRRRVFKKYIAY